MTVSVDGAAHATGQGTDLTGVDSVNTIPSVGTFTTGDLIVCATGGRDSGTAWTGRHAEFTNDFSAPGGYISCDADHKTPATRTAHRPWHGRYDKYAHSDRRPRRSRVV